MEPAEAPRAAPAASWAAPTGDPGAPSVGARSRPAGIVVALVATGIGWVLVGFELFVVYVFSGRDESCRGSATYQSCVRQEDVTELVAEGVAIGLAVLAIMVMFRTIQAGPTRWNEPVVRFAGGAGIALVIVCLLLWIDGSVGGWEPARPFPYDPIPSMWGHATMAIGIAAGLLLGRLVPVARQQRAGDS